VTEKIKISEQGVFFASLEKQEPQWLSNLRVKAFNKMSDLPLPKIDQVDFEQWRLFDQFFGCVEEVKEPPCFFKKKFRPLLVNVGSQNLFNQVPDELAKTGLIFADLHVALLKHEKLVKKYYLNNTLKYDSDRIAAEHTAFMNSGLFLYVPRGVELSVPIVACLYQNANSASPFNAHVLIIAEEDSKVIFDQKLASHGLEKKAVSANIFVEIFAMSNAKINYLAQDNLGENVTAYIRRRVLVHENAEVNFLLGSFNDGMVISDCAIDLKGIKSHAKMVIGAIATKRQTQVVNAKITNHAKFSSGEIVQHGVVKDSSRLIFNGIGHIKKGAKEASNKQENRILLLSDEMCGDVNPILLIDEEDVVATHSASLSHVTKEDLYYLMSRGIGEQEAENLVIKGFLNAAVKIDSSSSKKEWLAIMEGKLDG